jgi:hypothetical protein
MPSPAELLLAEMRTKLDGQIATLESLRTRSAVVLSVSGVIAGLFAQGLNGPIGNWGIAALIVFVLGSVPAIWILWPHKMTLSPQGEGWIEFAKGNDKWVRGQLKSESPDPEASFDLGASELALTMLPSMQRWYAGNAPMLDFLHKCLAVAAMGVVVQLICWGAAQIH